MTIRRLMRERMDDQRTDRESGGSVGDNAEPAKRSLLQRVTVVLAVVLFFAVVIYGPLVAHFAESRLFGSTHVLEFLRAMGVLDVLEFIYDHTPGIRH
jgi:hypothetical protein